jgi:hypothetical protein
MAPENQWARDQRKDVLQRLGSNGKARADELHVPSP